MKYQTKHFVVDAQQFDPEHKPWPRGVYEDYYHPQGPIFVNTIDGPRHVVRGDWVVYWSCDELDLYHEDEFYDDFEPVKEYEG